jgi:hypothetical protein
MSQPTGTMIFDSCQPLAQADETVGLEPSYQFAGGEPVIDLTAPNTVFVQTKGPRVALDPDEIAGVFPAAGSDDSAADFLPHVALRRRTLPWERSAPGSTKPPWLALLLIKPSDLNLTKLDSVLQKTTVGDLKAKDASTYNLLTGNPKPADSTPITVARLPNTQLKDILPATVAELTLLCHVKRVLYDADGTDRQDYAVVIGNRLPGPNPADPKSYEPHTALLVSLENRNDLYDAKNGNLSAALTSAGMGGGGQSQTTLIVLYSWTYTPSNGGDFAQVLRAISIQPNGGVLRFGNTPQPAAAGVTTLSGGFQPLLDADGYPLDPIPHAEHGEIRVRGPFCPFPFKLPDPMRYGVALRAEPSPSGIGRTLDYSYATAFELGRLMALGDVAILQLMRKLPDIPDRIINQKAMNKLPVALQKKDWVVDPAWEQPWSQTESLVKGDISQIQGNPGDTTGILQFGSQLQLTVTGVSQAGVVKPLVAVPLVLDKETPTSLGQKFPEVLNAGH